MSTATLITAIDAKIAQLLADTSNVGDYKIGDKKVDKGTFLTQLINARDKLLTQGQEEPYENIREFALDIDEFGVDSSEYIGDAST